MASMRRTIKRAIERNPNSWRGVNFKFGENRIERRRRAKAAQKARAEKKS